MKRLLVFATVVAALAICSTSNADITDAYWNADNDGVIDCQEWSWNSTTVTLWMSGVHNNGVPDPAGHMVGEIYTDTALDPILNIGGSIQNSTAGAWLGYTINVIMNNTFGIGPTFPTVDNPPNSDGWFVAGVGQPTLLVSGHWTGLCLGDIVYSRGV